MNYLNVVINGPEIFYGVETSNESEVIFPLISFFIFEEPKRPSMKKLA